MQELYALDWFEILSRIQQQATSENAKNRIQQTQALDSPQAALESFQSTQGAQQVLSQSPRPFMQSLDLYATWISRLKKSAVLKTLELR
ncbi:MAG: endonuclease MutS2, partial [Pseudobdellovibrionaceae bacterium]